MTQQDQATHANSSIEHAKQYEGQQKNNHDMAHTVQKGNSREKEQQKNTYSKTRKTEEDKKMNTHMQEESETAIRTYCVLFSFGYGIMAPKDQLDVWHPLVSRRTVELKKIVIAMKIARTSRYKNIGMCAQNQQSRKLP